MPEKLKEILAEKYEYPPQPLPYYIKLFSLILKTVVRTGAYLFFTHTLVSRAEECLKQKCSLFTK